ncbi:MAG: hypothetical protein WC422_00680 [Candidatus Paceibacterota bacterium]
MNQPVKKSAITLQILSVLPSPFSPGFGSGSGSGLGGKVGIGPSLPSAGILSQFSLYP